MPITYNYYDGYTEKGATISVGPDQRIEIDLPSAEYSNKWSYLKLVDWIKYGSDPEAREPHERYQDILRKSIQILDMNSGARVEEKLLFLKESIDILEETGRKFVDLPDLVPDLMHRYWIEYGKSGDDSVHNAIALNVCERYLKLCETDSYQDWFDRQHNSKGETLNRETEMEKLAETLLGMRNRLSSPPDEGDARLRAEQLLDRVKGWLLSRYNLNTAREIAFGKGSLRYWVAGWLPEGLALLTLTLVMTGWSSVEHPVLDRAPVRISLAVLLVYAFWVLAILNTVKELVSSRRKAELQVHLPRLGAGVLVGYLVILPDDFWRSTISNQTICFLISRGDMLMLLAGRMLIPLAVVFVYILIEMNNVKGIQYPIWPKAVKLAARGFAYAILIGVIVSDIFGAPIVGRVIKEMNVCINVLHVFPGIFGFVYREIILYLSPLALFIAVFIQLLWQDKALTDKI